MEQAEFEDNIQRPELDRTAPEAMFSYAKEKQRWLRKRVNEHQLDDAISHLISELDSYLSSTFDKPPELTVQTSDVRETTRIDKLKEGRYLVKNQETQLKGDAALLGEHNIKGTLYGFHRGEAGEVRIYLSQQQEPVDLGGGVFTPLLSISIQDSEIYLKEQKDAEELQSSESNVINSLEGYSQQILSLVRLFHDSIEGADLSDLERLRACADVLDAIAAHKEVSTQVMDGLIDILRIRLDLNTHQDVKASSYRLVMTEYPTASYKRFDAAHFTHVVPVIDFVGETNNKMLAFYFLAGERTVQVEVRNIVAIQKSTL